MNFLRRKPVLILIAVVLTIIILIIVGIKSRSKPVYAELQFWGVYDDKEAFDALISGYQQATGNLVEIKYKKFDNYEEYKKALDEALKKGAAPDIFMIHNSWVDEYKDVIQPFSNEKVYPLVNFKNDFVDVVYNDFVQNNKIYAFPFYVDTLALYYNRDLFNKAGIAQPPATWDEFLKDVELLTKKDSAGNIVQAGAAIGMARNVNRSTDILTLLMLQGGAKIFDKERNDFVFSRESAAERALTFYTDFANPIKKVYTWNQNMHYSIDSFYEEQTAMMFNYSHQIEIIKSRAPYLNYRIAKMPQIDPVSGKVINYANYWGGTVWKGSKFVEQAWGFLRYMTTSPQNLKKYLSYSKRPTPRKDMVNQERLDLELGVFAEQALSASSFYQKNPVAIETAFANMIDNVVFGRYNINEALKKAEDELNATIR